MDSSPNTNEALTGMRFSDLEPALSCDVIDALERSDFKFCTPIQAATIPLICSYNDVAVNSATGSGKTLSFLVPLVEILRRSISYPPKPHEVMGVIISPTFTKKKKKIISPTSELSTQIYNMAQPFVSTLTNVNSVLLVEGRDVKADMKTIEGEGGNILIGTPGRLQDIMEQMEILDFRYLQILILDEADRLLDMGLQKKQEVNSIISRLPTKRRTGLFSSTHTEDVKELAMAALRYPVRVEIGAESNSESLQQMTNFKTLPGLHSEYLVCEADKKSSQLVDLLIENKNKKLMVFFTTSDTVDYWGLVLSKFPTLNSISLIPIHGEGMNREARDKALALFKAASSGVLLCSDVTELRLDIGNIDCVVQYDLPYYPGDFIHRVHITASLGGQGRAIAFLMSEEKEYVWYMCPKGHFLHKRRSSENVSDVIPIIRAAAMEDRAVFEKGLKAFVSFVRGYTKHLFYNTGRWEKLEIGKLAMGYGLLYIPSMSEIKQDMLSIDGFIPVQDVNFEEIKFKDKDLEKQRQQELVARKEKREEARRKALNKRREDRRERLRAKIDKMHIENFLS